MEDAKITNIAPKNYEPKDEIDTTIGEQAETIEEPVVDSDATKETVIATPKKIVDPNNPYGEDSLKNVAKMVKESGEMVKMMDQLWNQSKKELSITDEHMKQLYQFNEEHKTPMPENLTDEEINKWDHFNGIDQIEDADIRKIFGDEHPVWGVDIDHTRDRIKGAVVDFFNWLAAMRHYREIHDAYLQLIEQGEEESINKLKETAEKEEDPTKKAKLQRAIDDYYNLKYLQFLTEIDDASIKTVLTVMKDEKKAIYWFNRSMDKLKQLKASSMFLMEISQFETRFLDKKYHKNNQVLLTYFMNLLIYKTNLNDQHDKGRAQVTCMLLMLDKIVRNACDTVSSSVIMENIRAFEDKFLPFIPDPEPTEEDEETNEEEVKEAHDDVAPAETTESESTTEEAVDVAEEQSVESTEELQSEAPTEVRVNDYHTESDGIRYPNPFRLSMDDYPEVYMINIMTFEIENGLTYLIKKAFSELTVLRNEIPTDMKIEDIMAICDTESLEIVVNNIKYKITGCTSMTWEEYSQQDVSKNPYFKALAKNNKEPLNKDVKFTFVGKTYKGLLKKADNEIEHSFHEWAMINVINDDTNEAKCMRVRDLYEEVTAGANYVKECRNINAVLRITKAELVDPDGSSNNNEYEEV